MDRHATGIFGKSSRIDDGRAIRKLTVIDAFTSVCLAIHLDRRIMSDNVVAAMAAPFAEREKAGRGGSPTKNRYCKSSNGKRRDELIGGKIFHTAEEARGVIEAWPQDCAAVYPHSAAGCGDPASESFVALAAATLTVALLRHARRHQPSLRSVNWEMPIYSATALQNLSAVRSRQMARRFLY